MAREEGLGLNSFFEFQAIEMLDYLRMKSEKKLAKNAMPSVQIERRRKRGWDVEREATLSKNDVARWECQFYTI